MKNQKLLLLLLALNIVLSLRLLGQPVVCGIGNELAFDEVNIDYTVDGTSHIIFGILAGDTYGKVYQYEDNELQLLPTNVTFPFTDASIATDQLILLSNEDSLAYAYLNNSILISISVDLEGVSSSRLVDGMNDKRWYALNNGTDGILYEYSSGALSNIGLAHIAYFDGQYYQTHTGREFMVAEDQNSDEFITLYDGTSFVDLTADVNFGLLNDFEVIDNLNSNYDDVIVGESSIGALSFHQYDGSSFKNITPVNVGGKWTKYESFTDVSGVAYLYLEGEDFNSNDKNGIYSIDKDDYTLTNVTPAAFFDKSVRVNYLPDGNTLLTKLREDRVFITSNGTINTRILSLNQELQTELRIGDTASYVLSQHAATDAVAIWQYDAGSFVDVTPSSGMELEYRGAETGADFWYLLFEEKITEKIKLYYLSKSNITEITPFDEQYESVNNAIEYMQPVVLNGVFYDNMIRQNLLQLFDPSIERDRVYLADGADLTEVVLNEHTIGSASRTRITELYSETGTNYHKDNNYYNKSLISLYNRDEGGIALYMIDENGHADLIKEYLNDASADDAFVFLGLDIDETWYFWVEGNNGSTVQDVISYDGSTTDVIAESFATCCDERLFNIYDDYGNLSFFRLTENATTPEIYNIFPEIQMKQPIANQLGLLNIRNLSTDESYKSNSEVLFNVFEQADFTLGFEVSPGVKMEIEMNTCEHQLGN